MSGVPADGVSSSQAAVSVPFESKASAAFIAIPLVVEIVRAGLEKVAPESADERHFTSRVVVPSSHPTTTRPPEAATAGRPGAAEQFEERFTGLENVPPPSVEREKNTSLPPPGPPQIGTNSPHATWIVELP